MAEPRGEGSQTSRGRRIAATLAVALVVFGVWKSIDYRMQPPPPPHPIGALPVGPQ